MHLISIDLQSSVCCTQSFVVLISLLGDARTENADEVSWFSLCSKMTQLFLCASHVFSVPYKICPALTADFNWGRHFAACISYLSNSLF